MSKEQEYLNDRIPSYEESVAGPRSQTNEKQSPRLSIQQRNRQKRARLVIDLTSAHIEPAISQHLEDGINCTVAILLPSDALPADIPVSKNSITSPALPSNTTLLRLSSDDYKSSFLHQPAVVQELASAIAAGLVDPNLLQPTPSNPASATAPLPSRPEAQTRSSLRYVLGIADANKDPTGSTGQWNLGWRSEEDTSSTTASVNTDEVSVTTRLQDISFRIENVMGLLESKSVKCIWCEVELKA